MYSCINILEYSTHTHIIIIHSAEFPDYEQSYTMYGGMKIDGFMQVWTAPYFVYFWLLPNNYTG